MCVTGHCTQLDAAPQQRPMSHCSLHQLIFRGKKYFCGSSVCLLMDLSPCALFLYRWPKNNLEGRHFGTFYKIQMSVLTNWKVFRQKPSSIATNNKSNASVAVWTILKGITLICEKNKISWLKESQSHYFPATPRNTQCVYNRSVLSGSQWTM
jgi:hypothetical protein